VKKKIIIAQLSISSLLLITGFSIFSHFSAFAVRQAKADSAISSTYLLNANVSNLLVTEIHYNPADTGDYEFIELKNVGDTQLDLTGVSVTGGMTMTLSSNIVQPGGFAVLAKNPTAFSERYATTTSPWYQSSLIIDGPWIGGLKNSGETFAVSAADNSPIAEITYSDKGDWPNRADGDGSAAELIDPAAVPTIQPAKDAYLADGNNWRSTSEYHGSPGRDGRGPDNRVVFNEILAHTDLPDVDTIELLNTTSADIDISGWLLSDDPATLNKYRMESGTILQAGSFLTLDESHFNNAANPNNPVPFALSSSNGENIYLLESDLVGNPLYFVDRVDFGATANGESYGRWLDGTGDLYPMESVTFGQSNRSNGNSVRTGPLIISEIQYNPAGADDNLEYIEIINSGLIAEDLSNWRLRGTVDFNYSGGLIVQAGEMIVMVGFDPVDTALADAFRSAYGIDGSVVLLGPWTDGGVLSVLLPDAGTVKLQRPDALQVPTDGSLSFYPMLEEDTVRYESSAPWPMKPLDGGPALERIDFDYYGDDPANWRASAPVGGSPGTIATPTPTPENTATAAPTDTSTNTPIATVADTSTSMPINTPVNTPVNTPTVTATATPANIFTPIPTDTPVPVSTNTPVPGPTNTPVAIPTSTVVPNSQVTPIVLPTNTSVPVVANTLVPTATSPSIPLPTNTATATSTATSLAIATNAATATAVLINTPMPIGTAISTNTPLSTVVLMPTATLVDTPVNTPVDTSAESALISFSATEIEDTRSAIMLEWNFGTDGPTVGFHVLRSATPKIGDAVQITDFMVPAFLAGTHTYQYSDDSLIQSGRYYYWIQEERFNEPLRIWGEVSGAFFGTSQIFIPYMSK